MISTKPNPRCSQGSFIPRKIFPPKYPPAAPPTRYGKAVIQSRFPLQRYIPADRTHRGKMTATEVAKAFLCSKSHTLVKRGTRIQPPPPPKNPFAVPVNAPARTTFQTDKKSPPFPPIMAGTEAIYVSFSLPAFPAACSVHAASHPGRHWRQPHARSTPYEQRVPCG